MDLVCCQKKITRANVFDLTIKNLYVNVKENIPQNRQPEQVRPIKISMVCYVDHSGDLFTCHIAHLDIILCQ